MPLSYEYAKSTLDDNGRKLLNMLDAWKKERGDIDFQDTDVGFNICLRTAHGPVTVLVFWGQLNQKESYVMESRQHEFPSFVRFQRSDAIQFSRELCGAYFQPCSGRHLNARLEFRLLPMTQVRLTMIVGAIDGAVNMVKAKVASNL